MQFAFVTLAVVGAGAMGRGIAQIAAQAGTKVHLFDNQSEAANKAIKIGRASCRERVLNLV